MWPRGSGRGILGEWRRSAPAPPSGPSALSGPATGGGDRHARFRTEAASGRGSAAPLRTSPTPPHARIALTRPPEARLATGSARPTVLADRRVGKHLDIAARLTRPGIPCRMARDGPGWPASAHRYASPARPEHRSSVNHAPVARRRRFRRALAAFVRPPAISGPPDVLPGTWRRVPAPSLTPANAGVAAPCGTATPGRRASGSQLPGAGTGRGSGEVRARVAPGPGYRSGRDQPSTAGAASSPRKNRVKR